jgi:Na+/H+ antiporter NhaD/arsenite permease-like protein
VSHAVCNPRAGHGPAFRSDSASDSRVIVVRELTLVIVVLTYLGVALGYFPGLRMNRASIALTGAAACVAVGLLSLEDAWKSVDGATIVLLLSMMILNANLALSGFFRLVARAVLARLSSPRALLGGIVVSSGVLSAIFLNDTVVLMLTPLVAIACKRLKKPPVPYLIALACAANAGSVATITGNPQNILIGVASKIPFLEFTARLGPVALVALGLTYVIVVLAYPKEFLSTQARAEDLSAHDRPLPIGRVHGPHLTRSLIAAAGMLVALVLGVNVATAAFVASSWLLITRRLKPERVFTEVNWTLLVLFAGLFVVTHALEVTGYSAQMFSSLEPLTKAGTFALSGVMLVLSNLVSNVPAVLLFKQIVPSLGDPTRVWLTLAMSSTLAGNLTLLGSVANLIVAEEAGRRGVRITFLEYLRVGVPLTVLSLLFGAFYLSR